MLAAVIDLCDKKLLGIHIRHLRMQMQLVKHLVIVVHFYSSLSSHIISFNKTSLQLHFVSKIRFLLLKNILIHVPIYIIRILTCLVHYITSVIMF